MTMRHTILSLAAGLLCSSLALGAQRPAAPKFDPALAAKPPVAAVPSKDATAAQAVNLPVLTVAQIVDRNAAARGGLKAWLQVKSMRLAGKLDAGRVRQDGGRIAMDPKVARAQAKAEARLALAGKAPTAEAEKIIQLPYQLDMKRPAKTRLEIPFQGETAVQVYDGAKGWKLRPYLGRHEVEPFSADELKIAASQQELDGPLINHAAKGIKVAVAGGEMVDDRAAYKLQLTLKNGDVRHLWVDAQTFLDVKIEGAPRRWDGKLRTVSTYFRDYKAVDGLMIPHRLETVVEGVRTAENIFVEKIALNPALADSRFGKPD